MLTVKEAASALGVSPHTLNGWRVQGRGPEYVQLAGWAVRYTDEAIQKFIEEGKRQSTSQPVQECA